MKYKCSELPRQKLINKYVLFHASEIKLFRWLNIKHVRILLEYEKKFVLAHYGKQTTQISLLEINSIDDIKDCEIIKVNKKYKSLRLPGCVKFVKKVLGLNKPFIIFPFQLKRFLRRLENG